MAKTPRELEVQQIEISQNSTPTRDIPKSILRALQCRMTINHTNGATVSGWTIDALLNLMSDVEFILNGQDVVHKVPLAFFFYQNFYDNGGVSSYTVDVTTSSNAISIVDFDINFANSRSISPDDTLMDLRSGISTAVLKTSFGAITATGVTFDSGTVEVCSDEYMYDASENSDMANKVRGRYETVYTQKTISTTGANDLELSVGAFNEYKRLFIETKNGSGVRSDSIIDKIEIFSGALTFVKKNADLIKTRNALDYGIAPASLLTGIYVIDLTRLGKMTQRLVTSQLSELKLRLNAIATGAVRIFAEKAIYGG